MRKQKGRIPAELLFGELVHLSHKIRSVGVSQGDTWNDTPPASCGAQAAIVVALGAPRNAPVVVGVGKIGLEADRFGIILDRKSVV